MNIHLKLAFARQKYLRAECRRHFQMQLLKEGVVILNQILMKIWSDGSNLSYFFLGWGNGLAPSRPQTIPWTYDKPFPEPTLTKMSHAAWCYGGAKNGGRELVRTFLPISHHGPLAIYVQLRVAHAPVMPGTFPRLHGFAIPTCIAARAWRTYRDAGRGR